jgi:hypothetical protein
MIRGNRGYLARGHGYTRPDRGQKYIRAAAPPPPRSRGAKGVLGYKWEEAGVNELIYRRTAGIFV